MNIELSRAQFLADCYTAGKYQGNWLLIPDPMTVVLQWMADGTLAELENLTKAYAPLENYLKTPENLDGFLKIRLGIE